MLEVLEIGLLALSPFGLWLLERVAAREHDVRDGLAKARLDLGEHRRSTLILGGVVEQRGDRFVLVSSILNHQGAHTEQVADVRDLAALADLSAVLLGSESQSLLESSAQGRLCRCRVT